MHWIHSLFLISHHSPCPSLTLISPPAHAHTGTLPDTICQATRLNVISLDGLTSSTHCVKFLWDPLHYFHSGYFAKSMRGECLVYCADAECVYV
jgi:hypothetical protein